MHRTRRQTSAAALGLLLASPAISQSVLTVDDDPGAQFQTIAAAVASAAPGDRVEVAPGTYAGFTLDLGVTVMGAGAAAVEVFGAVTVTQLPPGQTAVLADLALGNGQDGLAVDATAGALLVDGVEIDGELEVIAAADLRLHRCSVSDGAYVGASTAQFTSCEVHGRPGGTFIADGGIALWVDDADVVLKDTLVRGGDGEPGLPPLYIGGDGGTGVRVQGDGARVWLLDSTAAGGLADIGSSGGFGLRVLAGEAISGRSAVAGQTVAPNARVRDEPDFPALGLLGATATPGSAVTFECRASADASARLYAGREPRVDPMSFELPWFHSRERGASLGALPASGVATVPFTVPTLARGTIILAQFSRVTPAGDTELSNAVALIVR